MITVVSSDMCNLKHFLIKNFGEPVIKVELCSGAHVYIVKICGVDVLFADIGCQKVEIASSIAEINCYSPITYLISVTTGAYIRCRDDLICSIGIADCAIQYDIDETEMGFDIGYINCLKRVVLEADERLICLAKHAIAACKKNCLIGRVLSAERFLCSCFRGLYLLQKFCASFVDMNSAPVLEMGCIYKVPTLPLIGISNYGDNNASRDYYRYKDRMIEETMEVAITVVQMLIRCERKHI